jgi:uncharacterized protein YhfF
VIFRSPILDVEASILQFWRDYADRVPAGQHRPETPASVFAFGDSKELADELASLVRQGIKTATCSALWSYEEEQRPLPQKGEYSIVLDGNGVPVAVVETVEVFVAPFQRSPRAFRLRRRRRRSIADVLARSAPEFFRSPAFQASRLSRTDAAGL